MPFPVRPPLTHDLVLSFMSLPDPLFSPLREQPRPSRCRAYHGSGQHHLGDFSYVSYIRRIAIIS